MTSQQRSPLSLLAFICSLLLAATSVHAEGKIAVIVSKQMAGMTLNDSNLRAIYLKKIFLDQAGESLIPVNLPPGNPLRQAFTQAVIHMGESQLRNYWNRRYFQGVSPPYVLGSQKAVIRFVASTPGAVAYVSPCFVDSSVTTVLLMNAPGASSEPPESCPSSPDT